MKMFLKIAHIVLSGVGVLSIPHIALAGSSSFHGEITITGGNFCPRGFENAHGQLYPIENHQALFSLIGNHYGGDGRFTMQLPDMRGRYPAGTASPHDVGKAEGAAHNSLSVPKHQHRLQGTSAIGTTHTAAGTVFASPPSITLPNATTIDLPLYSNPESAQTIEFAKNSVSTVGSDTPPTNYAPSLGLTFCIAVQGQYPSRP